jgi:hypothetical protein
MNGVVLSDARLESIRRNLAIIRAESGGNLKLQNAERRISLELRRAGNKKVSGGVSKVSK